MISTIEIIKSSLIEIKKSIKILFCRHQMRGWDMKWFVEDETSYFYDRFNGKVWKDVFCQCQKCGVKYKKSLLVGKFGKWERSNFTPTNNSYIEVEIIESGKESKRQKRDRILRDLLD
jgi:hypothetical protein